MPYDNNLSGYLARNERKSKPSDPDFSGSAEINHVQYWASAWVNEGKQGGKMAGKRYFSLKFTPKDAPRAAVAPREDDMAPTPVAGAPAAAQTTAPADRSPPPPPKSQVERELDGEPDVPF